jgi:hypothetical protein
MTDDGESNQETPEPEPQAEPQSPKAAPHQPLGSLAYAVVAFLSLGVTLIVAYGLYLANQNAVSSPVLRSFYYVLLWVLGITSALFLFGVLRSTATLSGKQWGAAVDLGGPVVIGVLVVAGGYKFSQLPETFTLTVRLDGPYPVEQMASGAKLWIDLNGRREHDDFASNGQVVILEVPSAFLTDSVPITFESNGFRSSDGHNSMQLKVPENHVASITVVRIGQSELRRQRLADKYSRILEDVSLELTRKRAFLFPAIDRYVDHPTQDGWHDVVSASQDSLRRIHEQMDEEVEYQSQQRLLLIAQETSRTVSGGESLPRVPTFDNALAIHGQRAIGLGQIPTGLLPDAQAVRKWEANIEALYRQMESELTNLVRELRD